MQIRKPSPQDNATLQALGAALRARKPIPEIRQLFEDDDCDVRTCAAAQFGSIDPEWAAATLGGLFAKKRTAEVLALIRRARQPPPDQPTLQELWNDALIARFEDASTRQSATQFLHCMDDPKDMETHNRIVCEVTEIMRELKSRGQLALLQPYLSAPDMTVRHRAAQGCLRIAERQAVAALEEVAAKGDFNQRIRARDTLDHWRYGKCLIDGL